MGLSIPNSRLQSWSRQPMSRAQDESAPQPPATAAPAHNTRSAHAEPTSCAPERWRSTGAPHMTTERSETSISVHVKHGDAETGPPMSVNTSEQQWGAASPLPPERCVVDGHLIYMDHLCQKCEAQKGRGSKRRAQAQIMPVKPSGIHRGDTDIDERRIRHIRLVDVD
ncbi:hypothetical protein CONPUDRAFT_147770 [Coniophora puteana RWD-64-598 SS2]|uniref:Uncharacterized protein n=1 Tax=Coniophora puteana (strain RWD-64-598) TaxID=741705 RepID=R7SE46_CONPW|nr:uncharacterized protein CONPUDRAFT_147770 [Coniophora puteana RWD-64-598 SS2]EIW74446.1 hypothetical protein CONPUDRAFT_147770 [Coniophora puteana RWD-64-598 SS2]